MSTEREQIADQVFSEIESAVSWIADHIDELEAMDDFQLVDLYADIDDLNTKTSFLAVTTGMFGLVGEKYEPTGDEYRGYVRRYDQLTKHHATNAYRRFRAIADRMDDKWTAVEAVQKDRRERAALGGKTKAANAKPNPEKETAIQWSRLHPSLSSMQIKSRAKLRASDRTIRGWIGDCERED